MSKRKTLLRLLIRHVQVVERRRQVQRQDVPDFFMSVQNKCLLDLWEWGTTHQIYVHSVEII